MVAVNWFYVEFRLTAKKCLMRIGLIAEVIKLIIRHRGL